MKKGNPYANNSIFELNEELLRLKAETAKLQSLKQEQQRQRKSNNRAMAKIRELREQADSALRYKLNKALSDNLTNKD